MRDMCVHRRVCAFVCQHEQAAISPPVYNGSLSPTFNTPQCSGTATSPAWRSWLIAPVSFNSSVFPVFLHLLHLSLHLFFTCSTFWSGVQFESFWIKALDWTEESVGVWDMFFLCVSWRFSWLAMVSVGSPGGQTMSGWWDFLQDLCMMSHAYASGIQRPWGSVWRS